MLHRQQRPGPLHLPQGCPQDVRARLGVQRRRHWVRMVWVVVGGGGWGMGEKKGGSAGGGEAFCIYAAPNLPTYTPTHPAYAVLSALTPPLATLAMGSRTAATTARTMVCLGVKH